MGVGSIPWTSESQENGKARVGVWGGLDNIFEPDSLSPTPKSSHLLKTKQKRIKRGNAGQLRLRGSNLWRT